MWANSCLCAAVLLLSVLSTFVAESSCEDNQKGQNNLLKSENRDIASSIVNHVDKDTLAKKIGTTAFQSSKQWNLFEKVPAKTRTVPSLGSKIVQNSSLRNPKRIKTTPKELRFHTKEPSSLRSEGRGSKKYSNVFQSKERKRANKIQVQLTTAGSNNLEKILVRKPRFSPSVSSTCSHELSCRNNCTFPRNVIYANILACYCDTDCEFFKDCCADYGSECKGEDNWWNMKTNVQNNTNIDGNCTNNKQNNTNNNGINRLPNFGLNSFGTRKKRSTAMQTNLWTCFSYPYMNDSVKGIWMIGSCPTTWPKDDIFYKCKNLSVTNKITKDNYRYLPVYTSNGTVYHNRFCAQCYGETLGQLKSYQLSMDCDVTPPVHLSPSKKINFLFAYCNKITWEPKTLSIPRRYCLNVIDNCTTCTSQRQCSDGPARVVSKDKIFYKNVRCAECNGLSKFDVECGPYAAVHPPNPDDGTSPTPDPGRQPLSVTFDFSGALKTLSTVKCPDEEVYDEHLGICRKTLVVPPKSSGFTQYELALWLKIIRGCTDLTFGDEVRRSLILQPAQVTDLNLESIVKLWQLRFKIYLNGTVPLSKLLNNLLNFKCPFNYTIGHCTVTAIKATKQLLSCSNLQVFSRDEYTMLGSSVVIKSTGEVLEPTDYYKDGESSQSNESVSVCRHNQEISCSKTLVLMNEGDFVVLRNKAIFVNSSSRFYNISEYIWQNRRLFICENYDNPKSTKNDAVLIIVTDICMSLSIIALVFVLFTYSLFAELRTPPGINLMNLSVAILLAQFLWILGSGQTDKPAACTAIAILLHYLFLVSFVWTSIIAFDTWRAFTAKGRRSMADSKRKLLLQSLRYMAVGWLSVLVYVVICVVLDLTNTVTIGYQSSKACWMSDPRAILYFYAVPFVLIFTFNIMVYILTLKAINISTAQARAATDHTNRKHTFGIYVRIASAMGFTWILGFIAPFDMGFLWYPFVVLNGLQGVYIAMAFGLNQRARRLWKRLFVSIKMATENSSVEKNKNCDTTSTSVINDTRL